MTLDARKEMKSRIKAYTMSGDLIITLLTRHQIFNWRERLPLPSAHWCRRSAIQRKHLIALILSSQNIYYYFDLSPLCVELSAAVKYKY